MALPRLATTDPSWSALDGLRYGLMGLPLAFVALPLYVHLPRHYASEFGMSLTLLGTALLLARVFDAFTDPLLGRWTDRCFAVSHTRVWQIAAWAAAVLCLGLVGVWYPPVDSPYLAHWLVLGLMLTSTAYSQLQIAHQAWGARWGGSASHRSRVVAWREGHALVGVVLASVLPALLPWSGWLTVFGVCLLVGLLAWRQSPVPPAASATPVPPSLWLPWQRPAFRHLMGVFVLSGLASAIPATLVLFVVQDLLQATQWEPLFLSLYFISAALSIPLWLRTVRALGLVRSWLAGMGLAVTSFAWAGLLGAGDVLPYAVICVLSGMALGAELIIPSALLTGLVSAHHDQGRAEGAYLGWWNLASKLNLALAAGLALPLLDRLGYQPGVASAQGLWALAWVYAGLPCLLKGVAALVLYRWHTAPHPPRSD